MPSRQHAAPVSSGGLIAAAWVGRRLAHVGVLVVMTVGAGGCYRTSVERIVDGESVSHRFISARAYAYYALGVHAETEHRYAEAFSAYTEAARSDAEGPEPWTRRGAVACRLERFDEAKESFSKAEAADAEFAPLWRERAACALARSDLKLALRASERAEALEPESTETVLLRSTVLERTGDPVGALREVVALTIKNPSQSAWERQLGVAERTHDEPAARVARRALGAASTRNGPAASVAPRPVSLADLDAAIARGDERDAFSVGRRLKLAPGAIAVRAAALGHQAFAGKSAQRILGANPLDADAFVAAIIARESEPELPELAKLLDGSRGRSMSAPSSLASLLLLDALARRVGPGALASNASDPVLAARRSDPLEEEVRLRLVRNMGAAPAAAEARPPSALPAASAAASATPSPPSH